jgi:hypothetical protein
MSDNGIAINFLTQKSVTPQLRGYRITDIKQLINNKLTMRLFLFPKKQIKALLFIPENP